jgi:hypothetical protein
MKNLLAIIAIFFAVAAPWGLIGQGSTLTDKQELKARKEVEKEAVEAASELQKVENNLAEWGHASISGFVLVQDHSDFFDLNFSLPTTNYLAWTTTNVNGQASFLSQQSTMVQLTATAANAMSGLNVQGPPAPLTAQQQALADSQAQLNAANTQATLTNVALKLAVNNALEQAILQQLTNSPSGTSGTNGSNGTNMTLANIATLLNMISNNAPAPLNTNLFANPPTGPSNTTPVLPTLITNFPSNGGISNGFAPMAQLASAMSGNQISPDKAVMGAATAKEIERMLGFMSHPIDLPHNKQMFFAIGQISVMPGWRTKKDYICEVSIHFVYTGRAGELASRYQATHPDFQNLMKEDATNLIQQQGLMAYPPVITNEMVKTNRETTNGVATHAHDLDANGPDVVDTETMLRHYSLTDKNIRIYADSQRGRELHWNDSSSTLSLVAAFPFTESQVFDLQSSYRNQLNLLLNLAGTYVQAGYSVDANVLINYVKQVQKDLSTRTAFPTVIPGVEANMLTYRFDPEATAMTDPTETEPSAGHLLLPTSIPVMILVECDKQDLERWPELSADIETRWIPRENRSFWPDTGYWLTHYRIPDKKMRQQDGIILAEALDRASAKWNDIFERYVVKKKYNVTMFDELRRRLSALRTLGIGRSTLLRLPELMPAVTSVSPTVIADGDEGNLIIMGHYLGRAGMTEVRLNGVKLNVESSITNAIEAHINPSDHLMTGWNDLFVSNEFGGCVFTQAVNVIMRNPTFINFSPSQVGVDYMGPFTLVGSNLDAEPRLRLGNFTLETRRGNENTVTADTAKKPLRAGSYDLGFQNRRGGFTVGQVLTVTNVTPVISGISPSSIPFDFRGAIILSGDHLDGGAPTVRVGGIRLRVEMASVSPRRVEARRAEFLPVGTNDLEFGNSFGPASLPNAVIVTRPVPAIFGLSPTNVPQNFQGIITVTGQNFGTRVSRPSVWLGGIPLMVDRVSDTSVDVRFDPGQPNPDVRTSELVFRNDRGACTATQLVEVTAAPVPEDLHRPDIALNTILPPSGEGYVNIASKFFLKGSGFNPANHDKVKTVMVGTRMATNVQVLSDTLLQFEVPPWDISGKQLTNGQIRPFADSAHKADITVASQYKAQTLGTAVYFDLILPNSTPTTGGGTSATSNTNTLTGFIAQGLALAGTNASPQVGATFSLYAQVGAGKTNNPTSGTSSTVIIQNGQNTNAIR